VEKRLLMAKAKTSKSTPTAEQPPIDKKAKAAADLAALLNNTKTAPGIITQPLEKKAVSRSGWVGFLAIAALNIPIKTYKATDEDKLSFNTVHRCNSTTPDAPPVYGQLKDGMMRCPTCDVDVPNELRMSGFKYDDGKFVVISDDERKSVHVISDKKMNLVEFVPASQVDPLYFESAQYVCADKGGEKMLALLRQAMLKKNAVAVVVRAERGKQHTAVIRPMPNGGLVLHYIFAEHEVRSCDKFIDVVVPQQELEAMGSVVDAYMADFDANRPDPCTLNLKALIAAKIEGKAAPTVEREAAPVASTDLMAALKATLEAAMKKKAAKA
jgi:DNA end-binding protein Ku